MKLESVQIKNFRMLQDFEALFGYNGSTKKGGTFTYDDSKC